jgi:hypothetical protein
MVYVTYSDPPKWPVKVTPFCKETGGSRGVSLLLDTEVITGEARRRRFSTDLNSVVFAGGHAVRHVDARLKEAVRAEDESLPREERVGGLSAGGRFVKCSTACVRVST